MEQDGAVHPLREGGRPFRTKLRGRQAISENATRTDPEITAEDVAAWLSAHPDFLERRPDLLGKLAPPERELGDTVADFQQALIRRLKRTVDEHQALSRELIDTSRDNLSTTSQVHESIIRLLDANSFEQLIQIITTDFAVILDVDVVTLCIETREEDGFTLRMRGVHLVPPGTVDDLFRGHNGSVKLRGQVSGDPEIYGGAAPLVQSDALVKLNISPATPPALVAFASRHAERYHTGQATELLAFTGRVVERIVRLWLELPD